LAVLTRVAQEEHWGGAGMSEERLRELFEQAVELGSEDRARFLAASRASDGELTDELEELLAADAAAIKEEFWQQSAIRNQALEDLQAESAVGETAGNYRLVKLIGKGGMGSVYFAERMDAEFEKFVAIKLINATFYSPGLIANFRAERQILASLEHPYIARLLDGGARADGLPYLIMEYVEGISPYDYSRQNNLSIAQRLLLFRQICSAVHYAHQHMVIHRDLKPANILVTAEGTPKLLDFGIAKVLRPVTSPPGEALTEPGMLKMTVRYSSPEQVRGEAVTTASDVYSLGVILYELLTEHSPYGDADRATHLMMAAVCDEDPAKPSIWTSRLKGDLDNVVLRALRKAPSERYASVDQFSEDVLRYLEGRPVIARGDAPLYVATKFIRRNRVAVVAAALLLCSLVGGLIEVSLARARAERRFNQVRQLAHSVMFDYADAIDRLPGSTPVRARMVQDALTYLDNLSKEADNPRLQREIVDAYVHVSNVQGNEYQNNLGDTKGAMASGHKAADAAEKLLREDRTPPALDSAANAFSTYGDLLSATGDLAAADQAYRRVVELRREIDAKSAGSVENSLALSSCLRHMGDVYGDIGSQNLGKTAESLDYYGQAKVIVTKLAGQFPGNEEVAKETYETLLSLSASESGIGRRADAAKDLSEALTQIQKVSAAEPNDTNVNVELANAEARYGQVLIDNRDAANAVPHLAHSVGILDKLAQADPGNTIYRRGQSVVESQWAAALRGAGQVAGAVAHNERALQLALTLSHDAPANLQFRSDVGISERKLSDGLMAAGNIAGALHYAEQAGLILCQGKPAPSDAFTLANCGRSLVAAGNAHLALHDSTAALGDYRRAEKIASERSQAEPANAVFRSDWARSQAALAGGLASVADNQAARQSFDDALNNWSILRQANSLSAEDAHRADVAAHALAALPSKL